MLLAQQKLKKNMCASHKDLGIFSTMRTIYVDFVLFGHAENSFEDVILRLTRNTKYNLSFELKHNLK